MYDVKSDSKIGWALPILVTTLALADGILHLSLDAILFRGNFFGRLGPPPGATPPPGGGPPPPPVSLPLPLNQMFVLNFVGYVVLVALLWVTLRRSDPWRRLVEGAFILYVMLAFLAWVDVGRPNPMGLGYLSKAVEIALFFALLVFAGARAFGQRSVTTTMPPHAASQRQQTS